MDRKRFQELTTVWTCGVEGSKGGRERDGAKEDRRSKRSEVEEVEGR